MPCLTMWPLTLKSKNITRWQRYVHLSVRPSITRRCCIETAKFIVKQPTPQGKYGLPVFSCPRFWWPHSTHCTACMSSRCWVMATHNNSRLQKSLIFALSRSLSELGAGKWRTDGRTNIRTDGATNDRLECAVSQQDVSLNNKLTRQYHGAVQLASD